MCWNKGRLYWKRAKMFYFCHLKKFIRPDTFVPTLVPCLFNGGTHFILFMKFCTCVPLFQNLNLCSCIIYHWNFFPGVKGSSLSGAVLHPSKKQSLKCLSLQHIILAVTLLWQSWITGFLCLNPAHITRGEMKQSPCIACVAQRALHRVG
jgi:hypothetical protein